MNNLKDKILDTLRHPFVKDTAILQISNVFAIGFGIIISILIARLLQPENYGLYGLVFAFASLLGLFMNWGADKATITLLSEAYARKDKDEIRNILTYFLKINLIIFFTAGILFIILSPFLSVNLYQTATIGNLARLIIFTNLFGIFFGINAISLQILRQMGSYVFFDILNSLLKGIFSVAFILLGLSVFGVILSHLVVAILLFIISIFFYQYYILKKDPLWPPLKDLFLNFKNISAGRYFKFGVLIAADENVASLYSYLPMVFLGIFAAVSEIGYFKIALHYVKLPIVLLGPVSQLLNIQLPITKTAGLDSLKFNFIKATGYSLALAVFLTIILVFLAPYLVNFFYGAAFMPSVKLIYIFAVFSFLAAIGVGVGAMFRTLNKVSSAIIINVIIICLLSPVIFWLIKNYGAIGAGISAIGWPLISDAAGFFYILYILNKQIRDENINTNR